MIVCFCVYSRCDEFVVVVIPDVAAFAVICVDLFDVIVFNVVVFDIFDVGCLSVQTKLCVFDVIVFADLDAGVSDMVVVVIFWWSCLIFSPCSCLLLFPMRVWSLWLQARVAVIFPIFDLVLFDAVVTMLGVG